MNVSADSSQCVENRAAVGTATELGRRLLRNDAAAPVRPVTVAVPSRKAPRHRAQNFSHEPHNLV